MRDDTIIGSSPSGNSPGPDGVIPGEGPIEGAVSDSKETNTTDRSLPGNATLAFHLSRMYSLLALGFERPGGGLEGAIDEGAYCTDLVESANVVGEDTAEVALAVGTHLGDVDQLHDEWASLFSVEEGVTVSPYELTYMPGPLMTNVRKLADLSGFYEAFDLEVAPGRNDRRDHICFLLEFAGVLSLREAYLRVEGDEEGVAIVGDARRQFLEDHLGRWYWRFADEVSQHATGFYGALADLLAAVIDDEIDRLDLDPEWVPDDPQVTEWTEDVFGDSGRSCGGCGADTTENGNLGTPPGSMPQDPTGSGSVSSGKNDAGSDDDR